MGQRSITNNISIESKNFTGKFNWSLIRIRVKSIKKSTIRYTLRYLKWIIETKKNSGKYESRNCEKKISNKLKKNIKIKKNWFTLKNYIIKLC